MRAVVFFILLLIGSVSAHGNEEQLVKRCKVRLQNPDDAKLVDMEIEIKSTEPGSLEALISQTVDGVNSSSSETVNVVTEIIRSGLTPEIDYTDLNQVESLILHAIALQDPIFEGKYSAGLDLSKVRLAKAYILDEQTEMGFTAIVEAMDINGHLLGNFLGGFIVSPCQ